MLLEDGMDLIKNNDKLKTKNCIMCLDKIKEIILIQIKITVNLVLYID